MPDRSQNPKSDQTRRVTEVLGRIDLLLAALLTGDTHNPVTILVSRF